MTLYPPVYKNASTGVSFTALLKGEQRSLLGIQPKIRGGQGQRVGVKVGLKPHILISFSSPFSTICNMQHSLFDLEMGLRERVGRIS